MTDVPLRCRCGSVRGMASGVGPKSGNRIVCYCDDCRAYLRFLDREDLLDRFGGTDIYQMTPSQVTLSEGIANVACVRLSDKGMHRFYAACCNTPIGNTLASPRFPFVGMPRGLMDHDAHGQSRDEALGPVRAFVQGRFAVGGVPPHAAARAPVGIIFRFMSFLLRSWVAGRHAPSPFFDPKSGAPVVPPRVLTSDEREALRRSDTRPGRD